MHREKCSFCTPEFGRQFRYDWQVIRFIAPFRRTTERPRATIRILTHRGKYTCNRYLAYILASYVCDDWQKRPRTSWAEKLEPSKEDLKMMEGHGIRDLQKPFSSKD